MSNNLKTGPISANDLMHKLAHASKVMQKVETGNFSKGFVNEDLLQENDNIDYGANDFMMTQPITNKPQAPVSVDRINQSNLPDAIKKIMIENPIQQPMMTESLDMDFLKGAKRLIEQENGGATNKRLKQEFNRQPQQQNTNNSSIDMQAIAVLIENTVRKVMDEKLNQLLTAQQTTSINENLVLKVGDSIFKGKITGVNKAK